MPTMVISSALDAQARADIDSRPWYVVTYRDRDVVNVQEFSTLRPGRRLMSRHWNGFRLFDEPAYLAYAGGTMHTAASPGRCGRSSPPDRCATNLHRCRVSPPANFELAASKWCNAWPQDSSTGPTAAQSGHSSKSSPRSHPSIPIRHGAISTTKSP